MNDATEGAKMVDVMLKRIVIRDGKEQQFIFLKELQGDRGFPIVIGTSEAWEINRVVNKKQPKRPLTHQLAHECIRALGADLKRVDIIALRENTFFAQLVLQNASGDLTAVIDARPSDAVALALRAGCPVRVAESVLELVRTDESGPDPLPDASEDTPEPGE
jgi:bifunctional DNase/RNase